MQLFWVSFDGVEQTMEKVGGGDNATIETYEGHAWRVRSPSGVLVAQARSSSSLLTLMPCKQMHGKHAVVLPPRIADIYVTAEASVRDRWHGDALSAALAACDPWRYLSRAAMFIGFHVLCFLRHGEAAGSHTPEGIAVFSEGQWSEQPHAIIPWVDIADSSELLLVLEHALSLPSRPSHLQPAGFFNVDGLRLPSLDALLATSDASPRLLYEGGQWLWPPIAINHTWDVHANGHSVPRAHVDGEASALDARNGERVALQLVTISLRPAAFEIRAFLQGDEATYVQEKARPHMFASGIANVDADRGKNLGDVRTSTMTFISIDHDVRLKAIARRVQCLSRVSATHMEAVQVLNYQPWQHYQAHHDFFDPDFYQQQPAMLAQLRHGANNRLATIFMYMNDVPAGGQTAFPRAAGDAVPASKVLDCTLGTAVTPREGKALLFYSLMPSGDLDYASQHIGCDVKNGTKWAANFWLWSMDSPMNRGGGDARQFQEALERELAVNATC